MFDVWNESAPFRMGVYDATSKQMLTIGLIEKHLIPEDKFGFVLLSETPVELRGNKTIFGGKNWSIYVNPSVASGKWYVLPSLKRENGRVLCDRMIIVEDAWMSESYLKQFRQAKLNLPPEFADISGIQVCNVSSGKDGALTDDSAVFGWALAEEWDSSKPFRMGLYDNDSKKMLVTGFIPPEKVPADGKYHYCELPFEAMALGRRVTLFGGYKWHINLILAYPQHIPENAAWKIVVSLKNEQTRMLFDRAFLMPAMK